MSDNLRRYRAIRDALTQWYPGQPTGTVARHLTTLAAFISGIVASCPETFSHHCLEIKQSPCGNETQGDCMGQVCST